MKRWINHPELGIIMWDDKRHPGPGSRTPSYSEVLARRIEMRVTTDDGERVPVRG
jgi:hypothetical protein